MGGVCDCRGCEANACCPVFILYEQMGCEADACCAAFRSSDARRRAARAFSSRWIFFSALTLARLALFSSRFCSVASTQPLSIGSRTLRTSSPYSSTKNQSGNSSLMRSSLLSRACVASFVRILSGKIASGISIVSLKSRSQVSSRQDLSALRHASRRSPRRGPSPVPLRVGRCRASTSISFPG